jgi:hypothetical protein
MEKYRSKKAKGKSKIENKSGASPEGLFEKTKPRPAFGRKL